MSMIGQEALESEEAMDEAAIGMAPWPGFYNQTACANTRIVYVESDTDDESLEQVIELGSKIVAAYPDAAASDVDAAPGAEPGARGRDEAVALEDEFYHVEGDTMNGGVVVSRFPTGSISTTSSTTASSISCRCRTSLDVVKWCDDTTQTVGDLSGEPARAAARRARAGRRPAARPAGTAAIR